MVNSASPRSRVPTPSRKQQGDTPKETDSPSLQNKLRRCGAWARASHQASAPVQAERSGPMAGQSAPPGGAADTTPPTPKQAAQTPGSAGLKTSSHRSKSNSNVSVRPARSSSASAKAMDTTQGRPVQSTSGGRRCSDQ
ncbi:hypothetical protein V5799_011137 [Amblyomma americanum]|uniref:Uncharacterized protein n=1 Tax=Amblyomma americanum TaxID=6943 RepID=A0AAQ4EI28_AMBAM